MWVYSSLAAQHWSRDLDLECLSANIWFSHYIFSYSDLIKSQSNPFFVENVLRHCEPRRFAFTLCRNICVWRERKVHVWIDSSIRWLYHWTACRATGNTSLAVFIKSMDLLFVPAEEGQRRADRKNSIDSAAVKIRCDL